MFKIIKIIIVTIIVALNTVLTISVAKKAFTPAKKVFIPVQGCSSVVIKHVWVNEKDIIREINILREEESLPPLTINFLLEGSAQLKADNMVEENYWAHIAPNGDKPWILFREMGYYYTGAGENLARGFETAEKVVKAWFNSPKHKELMLDPKYKEIGVGQARNMIVAHFGVK